MNTIANKLPTSSSKAIFVLLAFILFSSPAFSQIKIVGIEEGNSEAPSATIKVRKKGEKGKDVVVKVGSEFDSGTEFHVPKNFTILLETSGTNQQQLKAGTKHRIEIGVKGEKHTTLWGKVKHFVTSAINLDWIYVTGGPTNDIQGAVHGTEFTVHVTEKKVKYHVQEGKVAIHRKVPVVIKEHEDGKERHGGEVAIMEKTYLEAHHGSATLKYKHPEVKRYPTFQKAIADIGRELQKSEADVNHHVDNMHVAGLYSLLGEFYLKNALGAPENKKGQAAEAIKNFTKAKEVYLRLHSEDHLLIAESDLFLAGAYFAYEGNDSAEGHKYLDEAIILIEEDIEENQKHYDFYMGLNDPHTAWAIGKDVVADLEDLAWAYELGGKLAEAKEYYGYADELKKEIKKH